MAEEVNEGKKSGKLKWIIIIVVVLALLGGGGFFAYTKFFAAPEEAPSEEAKVEKSLQDGEQPPVVGEGQLVPLPMFLVNLADPLGRRYLKLGLEVEVRDEKVAAELTTKQAQIKDSLLLLLSSKSYDSLSTLKSKIELKTEVVERLNQVLGNGSVLRVYITEMVIQ